MQGGHEGHAQIPECACVRGAGTTRYPRSPGLGGSRSGAEGPRGRASPCFAGPPVLDKEVRGEGSE